MRKYVIILALAGYLANSSQSFAQSAAGTHSWSADARHIALLDEGRVVWQLNIDPTQDKPYFHPLRTPSGLDMTLERPADHPWHRGLWFSWKDINGVNYWEEDPQRGVSDGRSIIKQVKSKLGKKTHRADIRIKLAYSDSTGTVLSERRRLTITPPQDGGYFITTDHEFKAEADARLYLEKPAKHGGVGWGGYAGFSFRGSDQLADVSFLAASGWETQADLTGYGEHEPWMGINAKNNGQDVALVIFDHQQNERFPSPWYVWYAKGHNLFFTPSVLFDGPLLLKKGQVLKLKYTVWITDGRVDSTAIEEQLDLKDKK